MIDMADTSSPVPTDPAIVHALAPETRQQMRHRLGRKLISIDTSEAMIVWLDKEAHAAGMSRNAFVNGLLRHARERAMENRRRSQKPESGTEE